MGYIRLGHYSPKAPGRHTQACRKDAMFPVAVSIDFDPLDQVVQRNVAGLCDAFVIGNRVTLIKLDFPWKERRGLTAKCRRAGRF